MKTQKEIAYEEFWGTLKHAYPISKGEIQLPIAKDLIEIPDLDHTMLIEELQSILKQLLTDEEIRNSAKDRAEKAGDTSLIPLINDDYTGIVRFDCLWNPDTSQISVLEINCDYPDGLLLHDKTYTALSQQRHKTHELLLNELYDNQDTKVLYSGDSFFLDAYAVEANNLQALGLDGEMITDLSETRPHTTIRRCLETSKMTDEMCVQMKSKELKPINSIALRTLGYKDLLEQLNHPYILKTKRVTAENVTYCNENKDNLVLKPIDGCEGFDIYFGNNLNVIEWSKLISTFVDKNYIVQQLAHVPQMKVRLFEEGTVLDKILYYDLCPHFFIKSGEVIGSGHTLMRFSENQIVNVSQGGGIGYYRL